MPGKRPTQSTHTCAGRTIENDPLRGLDPHLFVVFRMSERKLHGFLQNKHGVEMTGFPAETCPVHSLASRVCLSCNKNKLTFPLLLSETMLTPAAARPRRRGPRSHGAPGALRLPHTPNFPRVGRVTCNRDTRPCRGKDYKAWIHTSNGTAASEASCCCPIFTM